MFKRYYAYFVVYNFSNGLGNGSGAIEITRNRPIKNLDDVESVAKYIQEFTKSNELHLSNWIRLKPRREGIEGLKLNKI